MDDSSLKSYMSAKDPKQTSSPHQRQRNPAS